MDLVKKLKDEEALLEEEAEPPTSWKNFKTFLAGRDMSSRAWAAYTIALLGIGAAVLYMLITIF